MKNLHLYNFGIDRFFFTNRPINECARKKKAKISESQSFLKLDFCLMLIPVAWCTEVVISPLVLRAVIVLTL